MPKSSAAVPVDVIVIAWLLPVSVDFKINLYGSSPPTFRIEALTLPSVLSKISFFNCVRVVLPSTSIS